MKQKVSKVYERGVFTRVVFGEGGGTASNADVSGKFSEPMSSTWCSIHVRKLVVFMVMHSW